LYAPKTVRDVSLHYIARASSALRNKVNQQLTPRVAIGRRDGVELLVRVTCYVMRALIATAKTR
jgi:hypothetical protein